MISSWLLLSLAWGGAAETNANRIDKSLRWHILASCFICDSYTHKAVVFQNIFKFCTFLPKFSNILPFFTLFCPFSEKIACMLLLVNFVNWFRLELMYISLIENIRWSLIQNNANSPASCRCHPHFCHLHPLVKAVTFSPTFLSYQTYQWVMHCKCCFLCKSNWNLGNCLPKLQSHFQ